MLQPSIYGFLISSNKIIYYYVQPNYWIEWNKSVLFFIMTHFHFFKSLYYITDDSLIACKLTCVACKEVHFYMFSLRNINIRFLKKKKCHWSLCVTFGSQFPMLLGKETEGGKKGPNARRSGWASGASWWRSLWIGAEINALVSDRELSWEEELYISCAVKVSAK